MRRVRDEMGLTNVILMLPFVRRVAEADLVLQTMADLGLRRGENGLKVYAMCEIPNNVILIDEFAKRFDGFSIGSNDLTQLTLGRRSGQRDRGLRLRRARRGRQGDDPPGGGGLPPQRDSLGAVRTGAVGLPGHGRVPGPSSASSR